MAGRAGTAITRPSAFWDSSALVPLCVHQSTTPRVINFYKTYELVVWWASAVEIASALARLKRMGQLDPSQWTRSKKLAMDLADLWSVVQPSHALRAKAMQLIEQHDLRAADSLQLAAALEWCQDIPQGRVFLTADQKLRGAATFRGFDAKSI